MEHAILNEHYRFIKDYKATEHYRKSFNCLAKETFGIEFESWYLQGFWNDHYICYSALYEDQIVSNVSISRMELLINGKTVHGVQIGTVMTCSKHRRKGLAKALLMKVFEDQDEWADVYFLAADEEAWHLYETCGFHHIATQSAIIDLSGYSAIEPPKSVLLSADDLITLKSSTLPLSTTLSAVDDVHVLMFYYTHGFCDALYRLDKDLTLIYEKEDDTLHLYAIFSPVPYVFETVLKALAGEGISKVECHFTPDQQPMGLMRSDSIRQGWMIRDHKGMSFPLNSVFPTISKT